MDDYLFSNDLLLLYIELIIKSDVGTLQPDITVIRTVTVAPLLALVSATKTMTAPGCHSSRLYALSEVMLSDSCVYIAKRTGWIEGK